MLEMNDLQITSHRHQSVHGQIVPEMPSTVTVKHIPTSISVSCGSERTTSQNLHRAIQLLEEVLHELPRRTS